MIVDKDCRIGNNVSIEGKPDMPDADYGIYSVKDSIVVMKKGTVVNDGSNIS